MASELRPPISVLWNASTGNHHGHRITVTTAGKSWIRALPDQRANARRAGGTGSGPEV